MKCDNCNCQKSYVKDYEHNYIIKGKKINFIMPRRFCEKCNNLMYDRELDNSVSLKAIELYNKKYGISKEKIIELRKKLGLSQELFSKIIGCAKKTLISYEKGTSIPNDNYHILFNSLIANPEIIITFINSNKEIFSEKEYSKIQNNLISNFGNNYKNLYLNNLLHPSVYNGYNNFDKNKVFNMILLFSNGGVLKTKLLKEMFYADFLYFKNYGTSITGLEYAKLPYGPVPDDFENIIGECLNKKLIKYDVTYDYDVEYHNINALKKVKNNIFNTEELQIILQVKKFFKNYNSSKIVEYAHKEKAFIETDMNKKISYDYAFSIKDLN